MTHAIEVRGLKKVYGSGPTAYQALRGVDFCVDAGEFVMLSGPSGSGKTTLLSILGCVLRATSGTVHLLGRDVCGATEAELADVRLSSIGFVFQAHNLLAALPVIDNVKLLLDLRGLSPARARERAVRTLEAVGLGSKLESLPRDLSGGERQRVAIARALAGDPPFVLADEPTAALDAQNGLAVTEVLRSLAKQSHRTVVVVTHDSRIFHLADRIVQIEDGLIQEARS
jgi:putative ABC transport system ATP-binding protein